MRVVELKNQKQVTEETTESYSTLSEISITHKSYHEMSDTPVVEQDVLAQLHSNLEMLSDLQGRLSFLMREVRYLLKA